MKHDLATRDAVMTDYRWAIADKLGFVPFVHQADWWLATDGLLVTDQPARAQDPGVRVLIRADVMAESDVVLDERIIKGARCVVVRRRTLPRPQGRARVCADLGSFKIGKSHSAAIWAAGFAAIPGARVKLVGYEYDTCAPEFEYIVEAICSDRGMGTTPASLQNRPRDGRMWLDLPNGARFEARSWERKDGLKGKEDDCLPAGVPIWMGDFSFKPVEQIAVGDDVIGWGPQNRTRNGITPKGHQFGLMKTKVEAVLKKRAMVLRLTLKSGATIDCTACHRWLSGFHTSNRDYVKPRVGRALSRVVRVPRHLTHDEKETAAWLGGIYDGEGCREQICQSKTMNAPVYARIIAALERLGFGVSETKVGVRWRGGRQASLDFLTWTGVTRFKEKYADQMLLGGRCIAEADEIIGIEELGEREVYCFQTGTHNYVADGFISHNCYVFCEAYQLPGIECYTDFKQNLDARKGYAIFPTTPDRPWVEIFHQHGHGDPEFPDWQCVCGVARDVNPTSFDASQKEKDRKLMTREKFGIHYEGQIGRYIGSVFNYQRGQRQFTTTTHPDCWRDPANGSVIENFQIPAHWETFGAADTGTFTAGLLAALSPTGDLLFVYEQPNYRYIGGKHEFLDGASIATWKRDMRRAMDAARVRDLRADPNSQWKRELLSEPNGIHLRAGTADLEQRTEVLREYFQHGKVFLAPWLEVLPYELEQAQWPDDTTAGGRYRRVKKQDHTLDGAEHIAACRPRSVLVAERKPKLWIEEFTGHALTSTPTANPHMGIH